MRVARPVDKPPGPALRSVLPALLPPLGTAVIGRSVEVRWQVSSGPDVRPMDALEWFSMGCVGCGDAWPEVWDRPTGTPAGHALVPQWDEKSPGHFRWFGG